MIVEDLLDYYKLCICILVPTVFQSRKDNIVVLANRQQDYMFKQS